MTVLGRFAALYPWQVAASDDLSRAIAFLGWAYRPATVVRAGYGVGTTLVAATVVAVVALPRLPRLAVGLAGIALAVGAVHAVHAGPRLLATARRTNAIGTAPELLVLAVLRMRLSPSPERAAAFAARTGTGRLSDSLWRHVAQARGTERTGLDRFGDEWDEWYPALGRAVGLVVAAGAVPARERDRTLDRAMTVVLDGTRRQMRSFAASIRGPATALYAFGVLLPTALVALVPAARAAGLAATFPVVVGVYDVGLPLVLLAASGWLLARRPVAFPPPQVDAGHPDVPDRRRLAATAAVGAALFAAWVATRLLPPWAPPIAAVGVGLGTGLVINFRPHVRVYDRIRAIERGLTDATALIGRRVAHGQAVERALAETVPEVDGEIGAVLRRGVGRQRRLDVGVSAAFLGEEGALRTVPSPRVRGSVELLALAVQEGEPAGRAVLSMTEHLDDLARVEREAREDVRTVVETLRSTAACFGPLVGGATVALARHMGTGDLSVPGSAGVPGWLGLAVGWYVLALAAILTALATGLSRGLDRPLVGYRVGLALLAATATYFVGYLAAAAVA